MRYLNNYFNKYFNKFIYLYVIDRLTKYTYISLFNVPVNNINTILILNKFIFKILNNFPMFIYKNKIKFIVFVKTFIAKLYNIINSIKNINIINIQILNIFYKVIFISNKLIIKIHNFVNIIIYVPSKNIKFEIQQSNNIVIIISSYNKEFLTNLCAIIINSKKFNVYTNTGIKYLNQNIKLKKSIKLNKK